MTDTKSKYEALRKVYGAGQGKQGNTSDNAVNQTQQSDTKSKYEALKAKHENTQQSGTRKGTQAAGASTELTPVEKRQQAASVAAAKKVIQEVKQRHQSGNAQKTAALKPLDEQHLNSTSGIHYRTKAMEQDGKYIAERAEQEQVEALLNEAQKNLDAYLATDEYQRLSQLNQAAKAAALMQNTGVSTSPIRVSQTAVQKDTREEELRAIRDYYKNLLDTKKDQAIMEADLAELEKWTDEDRAAMETYVNYRQSGVTNGGFAVPAQKAYSMLSEKYGKEKVNELAYSWQRNQNAKATQALKESVAEAVKGKTGASILHSAATVPANLLGSVTSVYGTLMDLAARDKRYATLDPNNAGNMFSVYSGAVRGQVAENISADQYDENGNLIKDGGKVRGALATVYEAGMSAADNLARIFVSGGNEALSLGLAATGSFGQTVSEMSAQGANPVQAVAMGIMSGGLEVITEKISLDNLFKQAAAGPKNLKAVLGGILKSGAIEVSEEELNFICSTAMEALVMRGKSAYNQQVQQLIMQGKSYQEAVNAADAALLGEAVSTAVQSFLSGSMMGGGAQVVSAYRTNQLGKDFEKLNLEKGDIQDLIDSGLESNHDTDSYKIAQEVQKKIEAGETPSSYELARLYQANTQAMVEEQEQKTQKQNPINPDAHVELADMQVQFEQETWDLCDRLAKATGRNIKLYQHYGPGNSIENGYFENGVIYVNTKSGDPVAQIISHELTHSMEFAQEYKELSRMVLGRIESLSGDLKQLRQQKANLYAQAGHPLGSQDEIDQEIVAEYVAKNLLTNEQQIMEVAQQNRTLIEKIKGWIDKLLGALGNKDAAERAYLTKVQSLYAKALQQTRTSIQQTTPVAVQMQEENIVPDDSEEVDWNDPVQVRTWAQNMLSSGQITGEEFNGYIDLAEQIAEENAGREIFESGSGQKFSISTISGEKAAYGQGVLLDTNIFDGVRPRAWGQVLSDFVYKNLAGKEMTVYDESGNAEIIYLAKENDRVRKDGAKNSHKVLDKLAGFRGDQVRAQAIVQLSEVLQASRYENSTDEHSHQWLDENGWIFRKVYLQTKDGKIYEATLNIADGRNQKTLYEVNRVHQIDKKETPASIPSTDNSQRSRYQEPGMGGTQSEVTGKMLTEETNPVKRQYSFAGVNARNANLQTLAEAKALDEQGVANETIRQQTGWFKGMDAKWRFEVDDSSSRISENDSNYMTLGELLQDTEIFEAYPDLRDISVVFQSLPPGVYAQYNRQFDHIDVSYELKDVPEAIRDAVLHEIQHAIQNREGFTGGATVGSWDRKIKAGFDSRRGADIRKARETEMEIRRVQQVEPEFYRDMMELDAMTPDIPRGEVDWDTLEEISEDAPEWQAFDARREKLQETYGDIKVWDFMDLLYQQEKAAKNEGRTAIELYWDTAGEIEARNTAGRRNLTAEERKNTLPNLGDEDTVFAETSTRSDQAIGKTTDNRPFVTIDTDILAGVPSQNWVKTVTDNLKQKFPSGITVGRNSIYVDRQSRKEMTFSKYTRWLMNNDPSLYEDKLRATNNVDEIIKAATDWVNEGLNHPRKDNITDFARGNVFLSIGGKQYSAEVVVGTRANGSMVVYDLLKIMPTQFTEKEMNMAITENPSPEADRNTMFISEANIAQESDGVNRKYSISPATVNKRDVADDLRGILSRGGDVAELRRYISQLERGGGNVEQSGRNAEQSGSQSIIQAAKRNGISVEEYLRQNWEQYDVDGQWNADARAALEQERRGRKYSVSEMEEQAEQKTAEQIRQEMPTKARNYLQGAQRKLLTLLYDKLGVNRFTNREDLQEIITEIADAYLTTGKVEDGKMGELFDRAYAGGIVKDAEFYEQYREIKQHLRTNAVTISAGDSHDIADFQDFKRRNFGTLRIVKEGGLPVDSAYHELNTMAPELFPEGITHPADQLVRMAEVARSIQMSEKNLNEYYGSSREDFRRDARHEFETALADVLGDFQQVKRYIEGKEEMQEAAPTKPEEAAGYYKQLKDARRTYEKAQAKNLLTPQDEMQLGKLLRGEITLEDLNPEKDFVKGITAVYEGKKEYERLCRLLAEYKRTVRGGYREKADGYLETANEWKDKKIGLAYSHETMERNIDDIVPDNEVAKAIKREYFEAVHISEAEATRFKTEFRNRVRGMNLSIKIKKGNLVSEAHAVQLLGEAEDNIRVLQKAKGRMKTRDGKTLEEWRSVVAELWKENPGLDQTKIRSAVNEFRKIYDELFEKMNTVRIRNGYEPVNYRQGYFPHFQPGEGDGILGAFGKALNIDTQVAALPTTINGLTHTFKPGIQWFGNAQERLGFNTAYDAVEGFDKYIEGVASVIYQTENIQKLRALAGQIRYRTTEDGIRKQVDEIRARDNLTEDEKQVQINSIYEHGKYALSNFVNELDEYTNLLANKKSKLDRTMEAMMGRKAYTVMKAWEARVGANMIAGNLSSALTNFIPLTQAGAQLDKGSLIKGIAATLKAYKEDDGIAGMSTFLTNRRGSDPLVQTWVQKASKVMGTPMELIDGFTADSIVRAAYFQNLKRGMSEAEAMNQADVFASHVMADRSKGAMPTLFESKNPIFKAFTQFQLEVNNQFSEVFKDLPRGHRERGLAALTMVLLKYFLGAFLYNEAYEYFVGRRPALDPFGILNDTVGDLTGYELPNMVEWVTNTIKGEVTSFETEKVGIGEAGTNLASTMLGELPFSAGLTLVGVETDGGRIPASSAVPDLSALWKAATEEEWSAEKRWKEIQDELNKLSYVIPPFGGNQIGKIWKGVKAFAEGGSYGVDAEGNDVLQYPVYKDNPEDAFWNMVRMTIMGKSALPEAQDWVNSGFDSLGANQTAVYQDMLESGENDRKAFALLRQLETAEKTEGGSKKLSQMEMLENSDVNQKSKTIVYYGLLATDSERELMDSLADSGAEQSEIGKLMMDLHRAAQLKGSKKCEAQQKALQGVPMTDEEKILVIGSILGTELTTEKGNPTQYANFLSATNRGLSVDDFMDMRSKGVDVEEYLEATDAGVRSDAALRLAYDMFELDEREDTENTDYWRICVNSSSNESMQIAMMGKYMDDATFKKVAMAQRLDVSPDMFVTYYEERSKFDQDGNGSYTQAEVKAVIEAMGASYTDEQKGVLWQLATGSTSTKNNPYSKSAGQKWLDAKAADKEKS